jgi:Toastrack DUF4097
MKRIVSTSRLHVTCVLAIVVGLTALASATTYQGSFKRDLPVTGTVDLEVLTHSGDITIHSGAAGTVSIQGRIHVNDRWRNGGKESEIHELEQNPPIRQAGNSIHIEYADVHDISIDYEITVPADTSVRTQSGSGDQTIEGLRNNLNLESGSGDMKLHDIKGDVRAHTGSGNVEAREVTGSFNAEAGSGDIRLEATVANDVRVHTGSGNIEARGVQGGLHVEAGSGDITVDGVPSQAWEVRTGSGNVRLRLPGEAGFNLEASTGSGELVVNHPVTIQGSIGSSRHSISGPVHGGGPVLMVHTGSGDVQID